MERLLSKFTNLYPVWLLSGAAVSLFRPETFAWFTGPWITWAIGAVMLGMGFTLSTSDFKRLAKTPGALALGFVAHYTIMPLTGWLLGRVLALEPDIAVGLILVASCPSGTASNVVCFLAKADVALAVSVTLISTLFAFITTPLWCRLLAGHYVPVDAVGLSISTLKAVVAPVLIGVLCNWKFPRFVAKASRFGPLVSVVAIVLITSGIVAQNATAVLSNFGKLALGAFLLHVLGFILGYAVARFFGYPAITARTVSIEVGMQNGGMAAMLAKKNFPTQPLAAVPAVFSGVVQNILGSLIAAWCRRHPLEENQPKA